jgi:hypothetical protein
MCIRLKRSAPQLQIRSRCQRALALSRAPRHRARHPLEEGSGVATCPTAQSAPPTRKGLRCRPCAPRHRVCHPSGKVSDVATCPETLIPTPNRRGLQSRHVPRGSRTAPYVGRLWRRHVTKAPGPLLGKAPVSPCVQWLQTRLLVKEGSGAATCPVALGLGACSCVLKTPDIRLIMVSPGTRSRQRIKCVCDMPYIVYDRH